MESILKSLSAESIVYLLVEIEPESLSEESKTEVFSAEEHLVVFYSFSAGKKRSL